MKPNVPRETSANTQSPTPVRDVLFDAPLRAARVRGSIIGDKKLTAHTLPWQANIKTKTETEKTETAETFARKPRVSVNNNAPLTAPASARGDSNFRRERGYSKMSPQGQVNALPNNRAQVFNSSVFRAFGLAAIVFVLLVAAYWVLPPVTRLLERPLKNVAVEGEFHYLPKDRAMTLIAAEIDGDFMGLHLEHLKTVLQTDPWIEHVSLSRRWPDTLVVKIAEQQPIALWDADGFLNQRGEIIRVPETQKLAGLPRLQGNESHAREMMQQYQDSATLLRTRGLEIVSLQCDNKKSWRIILKSGVEIVIGRDQVMEKLQRFVTVYDNFLSGVWRDVQAVDVRYTNGAAVRWLPESEMAKKYVKPEAARVKKLS
jgi:cell division protein FtsQ